MISNDMSISHLNEHGTVANDSNSLIFFMLKWLFKMLIDTKLGKMFGNERFIKE